MTPRPSTTPRFANPRLTRRRVLAIGGASLVAALLPACSNESGEGPAPGERDTLPEGDKGVIIGSARFLAEDGRKRYFLALVDLDTARPKPLRMPLAFFAHGMVPHPVRRERLALFEKRGKGACEVDLSQGRVLRPINTLPSREFYGHGAYSPDGKRLYATESDVEDGYRGVVAVRDPETMALIGEFPTFGTAPHDCHLVDGGRTMVVTNGGDPLGGASAPSVTIIDVEKRELKERLEFDTPNINAGHLARSRAGDLAIVSAPRDGLENQTSRPGAISLRPAGGALKTLTEPTAVTSRMTSETLSVAIHEPSGIVGATNPAGNLVTFWKLDTGKFVSALDLEDARGIVLTEDQREFVISLGKAQGGLVRVSVETLRPLPGVPRIATSIAGSHLINYRWNA